MFLALKNLRTYPPRALIRKPSIIYWENLFASNISRIIKKNNFDLIHAHFAYPEGLVGFLTKKKTKKSLIITVHGYDILVEKTVGYGVRLDKRI